MDRRSSRLIMTIGLAGMVVLAVIAVLVSSLTS